MSQPLSWMRVIQQGPNRCGCYKGGVTGHRGKPGDPQQPRKHEYITEVQEAGAERKGGLPSVGCQEGRTVLASLDAHGSAFPEPSPAVGDGGIFMVYNLKAKGLCEHLELI